MFVVTADQVDSRHRPDEVNVTVAALERAFRTGLERAPQRTAGDEFQFVVSDPAVVLDAVLWLTRAGGWSVGVGIGAVDRPLPTDARAGSGPAFVAARRAVEAAKKSPTRCVVLTAAEPPAPGEVGPLLDLLLSLRARRSAEGWEVFDLAAHGLPQKEMAARLSISEQAVSARARAAELRLEEAALVPLRGLLDAANRAAAPAPDGGR